MGVAGVWYVISPVEQVRKRVSEADQDFLWLSCSSRLQKLLVTLWLYSDLCLIDGVELLGISSAVDIYSFNSRRCHYFHAAYLAAKHALVIEGKGAQSERQVHLPLTIIATTIAPPSLKEALHNVDQLDKLEQRVSTADAGVDHLKGYLLRQERVG